MTNRCTGSSYYLIFGNHINAYSIIKGLRTFGIPDHNMAIIKDQGYPTLAAEFFNRSIRCLEIDKDSTAKLPKKLRAEFGTNTRKYLFFTDERFLPLFMQEKRNGRSEDFFFFAGQPRYLDTILDRLLFCQFINENKIASVPITIPSTEDPWKHFPTGFILRPRYSWSSNGRRQRVAVVRSKRELLRCEKQFLNCNSKRNDWCYQELLSIDAQNNLSVCGWYDRYSSPQFIYCTHKVLQHPDPCGNGDVVELAPDVPKRIMEASLALLSSINYEGPFELEWIFDQNAKIYKIIELNPRYWMQHELVGYLTGDALIGKYIGAANSFNQPSHPKTIWVNSLYALFRALKGDFRGMRYYMQKSVKPLTLFQAAAYAPIHFLGKGKI